MSVSYADLGAVWPGTVYFTPRTTPVAQAAEVHHMSSSKAPSAAVGRDPAAASFSLTSQWTFKGPTAAAAAASAGAKGGRSTPSGKPPIPPAKRKQRTSDPEEPTNDAKTDANRTVKPKTTRSSSQVSPFKQISAEGQSSLPPPVAAASPDDMVELLNANSTMDKKSKGKDDKDVSDARVALRVLPGGQVTPRPKSAAPKDSATKHEGDQAAKGKFRGPKRSGSATDVSSDVGGASMSRRRVSQWHPGMHAAYGMTLISPMAAAHAQTPPPVVSGDPERYQSIPLTAEDVPKFNESDPLRATLEYLRYLATSVGRIPTFPSKVQVSFNAEQKIYRERLARILLSRDGRYTEKPRPGGTRRSSRTRFAPDVFIPTLAGGPDGRGTVYGSNGRPNRVEGEDEGGEFEAGGIIIQPFDPSVLTDVRLGSSFQADLPGLLRKPAAPPAEDSCWVESLVLPAGTAPPPRRLRRDVNCKRAWEDENHALAIKKEVAKLVSAIGDEAAQNLGLGRMGTVMADDLTEEQQDKLYEGMKLYSRDFHAISKEFVPGVAPRRLSGFYYDVWKLWGCPAARRWHEDKLNEEKQAEAEAEALEKQRLEDAARRAERQEASNRRRQVKESVQWIKASAKAPAEVNFNKPVVRERSARIHNVLRQIGAMELEQEKKKK